jgi:hypothetical protein
LEALDTRLPGILLALDAPIKPRKSIRISIPLARIKEIVRLMLPTRASRISIPFTIHASILDHGRRALVCRSKADALVQRVDGVVGAQGEVALATDGGGPVIEGATALRQVEGLIVEEPMEVCVLIALMSAVEVAPVPPHHTPASFSTPHPLSRASWVGFDM